MTLLSGEGYRGRTIGRGCGVTGRVAAFGETAGRTIGRVQHAFLAPVLVVITKTAYLNGLIFANRA